MAVKDLYNEKKKEKNPYGTYSTAIPRTQSTLKSSGWDAGQSTARMQSVPQNDAVQKPKREKSPSELGEEVVRIMLEDYAAEERQKQAAADRTARYGSGAAGTKAAGNRKTAQYFDTAGQFGGAASYSSPSAAKPAAGNQKAAPYSGAATAQYNTGTAAQAAAIPKAAPYASPAATVPTVRKREKTPSELGDAVVARVLVEEGIMDPKDLEEYLASFEEPAARTFTEGVGRDDIIGSDAYAARNTASGDGLSGEAGTAGEDTGPTQDIPEWLALMLTQDPPYLRLTESAIRVGSELKDKIEQLTPDQVNQLALDWLPLLSIQDSDYPGLTAAANLVGFEVKDKIEQLTPDQVNQLALDWLPSLSTPYSDYPELAAFADQAGPLLWDQTKQLWDDTHIAEGTSVPLYLIEKGLIGAATGLEGAYNDMIDLAWAGVNADLEQQKQQAQQFSFLGGPYQTYADQIADTARSIQETLPEAAEKLRSHKAAEQAQKMEIQDREALPRKGNNDILNDKSDSKKLEQKEWWEKSGASEPIDPDDPAYQAMDAVLTDEDRAGGLSVVKLDGEYYIDYTPTINTRLQEVEPYFRIHTIYDPRVIQDGKILLSNILWFVSQVNEYGPWDIKVENSWKMQFGNVRYLSDMSDPIAYNGQVVRAENLGNLTYGYLGRAMGWPAEILYLGAGFFNRFKLACDSTGALVMGKGDISACLNSWLNFINPLIYTDGSYGDGENDYEFIKQGVELYEAVH